MVERLLAGFAAPLAEGGLGGTIAAAQYPISPVGERRIAILGD